MPSHQRKKIPAKVCTLNFGNEGMEDVNYVTTVMLRLNAPSNRRPPF